jgi:hypothetical protein
MATQGGILGLRGTVGGLTFRSDGSVSQKAASRAVTAKRTQENNAEFGTAATAGKLVRGAFRALMNAVKSRDVVGRLSQTMSRIVKLDGTADRGLRQVLKDNIGALVGFDFSATSLSQAFFAPFTAVVAGSDFTVTIPSLTPVQDLNAPQGATHFQVLVGAAAVDFAGNVVQVAAGAGLAPQAINAVAQANVTTTLAFATAPAATDAVIGVVGVAYFQEVNGALYPLNDASANALGVVLAE